MCLQCLPFFSRAHDDSPPSSPRPVVTSPKPKPSAAPPCDVSEETAPLVEESSLTPSAYPALESESSLQPSYGTPQSSFPEEYEPSVQSSYGAPGSTFPGEPFFTPSAASSQAYDSKVEPPAFSKPAPAMEPESLSESVYTPLQTSFQEFQFPADGLSFVPETPLPIGEVAQIGSDLSSTQSLPPPLNNNIPESSLESALSEPNLTEEHPAEKHPQYPPGFEGAEHQEEHPHHHHHISQHLHGLRKQLKEGGKQLKEGGLFLKEEGSRHFQHFLNNKT